MRGLKEMKDVSNSGSYARRLCFWKKEPPLRRSIPVMVTYKNDDVRKHIAPFDGAAYRYKREESRGG